MTLWTKRVLYLSCFLIFFILTPIIILYTQGYRYNQAKEKLESTGVIYIKSYPRNAKIILNGLDTNKTTPQQLSYLPSSFYDLTVTQDGYFPWIKKLFLPSSQTVFIEDIALFKNKPVNIYNHTTSLTNLTLSTNHQATFWKKNNPGSELWLFDAQTEKTKLLLNWTKTTDLPRIKWSANNQRLILQATATTPVIIKLDADNQINFNQLTNLLQKI